jgi:aminoglycoside/choline kinase family phosphotransferase
VNGYYQQLKQLFKKFKGQEPEEIIPLPPSGSNRQYFRLVQGDFSAVAAYNPDRIENEAFLYISEKLRGADVNVPKIYITNLDKHIYLQEDLGDIDLFKLVDADRHHQKTDYLNWYKKVIAQMPAIQYTASRNFDFSKCFPREAFDKQSILWDLNYFKYHFLKLAYTPFHEQKLEDDFHKLADFLMEASSDFFLFRDFQSRNVMIFDDQPYFIDYQGGRRGALQYDLASLVFEAKTALPVETREKLIELYIDTFSEFKFFDRKAFLKYFPAFVLVRSLQAFGAYGYRGYFERKPHFLQSIPPAIQNLHWLLDNYELGIDVPHLRETLYRMVSIPAFNELPVSLNKLTVTIQSFSYKKGIPDDFTGNGGGFVFDCRALPNPGRLYEYRNLTGMDAPVRNYLKDKPEVLSFLEHSNQLILASVDEYVRRGFEHLMVSFGCTGGQHRSVYCADSIHKALSIRGDIELILRHREKPEI